MDDDIVTRLRHTTDYDCEMQGEAADEIERLRAMLVAALENNDYWRDVAHKAMCDICKNNND